MVTRPPLSPAERTTILQPNLRYRDARGRFRAFTPEERFQLDTMDARAEYHARRVAGQTREYDVFRGARSGVEFGIRRGAIVPLNERTLERQVESLADKGSTYLLRELRVVSPIDTGLLRSRWQLGRNQVSNDVPYVPQTEYINRSSRGYIRRAVAKTMRYMARNGLPGLKTEIERKRTTMRI